MSLVALAYLVFVSLSATPSGPAPRPLRWGELLALVAGDSLPENITSEIQSRGLTFSPDDNYKSLLKTAGADTSVLGALTTAKVLSGEQLDRGSESALLQYLSAAGKMLHASQLDEATNELTEAIARGTGR